MNLPNQLTVARIAMIPVFVALLFLPQFVDVSYMRFAALGVFALASLTDMLDGQIARKNNLITDLGKFLDPIADKMLVICALIAVCVDKVMFSMDYVVLAVLAASTMLIVCRELAVSAFRIIAAGKGVKLAADKLGKIKTVLQMIALLVLIPVGDIFKLNQTAGDIFLWSGIVILLLATIMTVVSGANYMVKNRAVLTQDDSAAIHTEDNEA